MVFKKAKSELLIETEEKESEWEQFLYFLSGRT